MLREIDKRLNKLFDLHEDIRRAEVKGDTQAITNLMTDGLATSCLLLRDMLRDSNVMQLKGDAGARAELRRLYREKKLGPFLHLEKDLLAITKLKPEVVDELVSALGKIGLSQDPPENWQASVEKLRDVVCNAAHESAKSVRHRPLIRRVFLAGGGAMIALLNTFPPPPFSISVWETTASVTAGLWLIEKALESELDDFLGS